MTSQKAMVPVIVHPPRRDRTWLLVGAAACAALALLAAARLTRWNSDEAIPVLMSNDGHRGWFDLYYWGQDRLGALPWRLAAAVHRLGVDWTPERLTFLHAAWALSGVCILPWRLGRVAWPAAAAFAAAAALLPFADVYFAPGHPYGGQLTLVFATLAVLSAPAVTRGHVAAATAFCFLACWESSASAPLLMAAVTALHLGLERRWRAAAPRVIPVVLGTGLELAVRGLYQVGAKRAFGRSFAGNQILDWGHLADNVHAMGSRFVAHPSAAIAGVVATAALIAYLWNPERLGRLRLQGAWVAALAAAALANGVLSTLVDHVRKNDYSERYLTPSALLVVAAATLAVTLEAQLRAPRLERAWPLGLLLFAWPLGAVALRPARDDTAWAKATLERLRGAGADLLVGGYWDVYAVVGLDASRRVEGAVVEGDYDRTPWTPRLLSQAAGAWLVVRESDKVGTGARSSPVRLEHGHVLAVDLARSVSVAGATLSPLAARHDARPLAPGVLPYSRADCGGVAIPLAADLPRGRLWVRTPLPPGQLELAAESGEGPVLLRPSRAFAEHAEFAVPRALRAATLHVAPGAGRCTVLRAAWLPDDDALP